MSRHFRDLSITRSLFWVAICLGVSLVGERESMGACGYRSAPLIFSAKSNLTFDGLGPRSIWLPQRMVVFEEGRIGWNFSANPSKCQGLDCRGHRRPLTQSSLPVVPVRTVVSNPATADLTLENTFKLRLMPSIGALSLIDESVESVAEQPPVPPPKIDQAGLL